MQQQCVWMAQAAVVQKYYHQPYSNKHIKYDANNISHVHEHTHTHSSINSNNHIRYKFTYIKLEWQKKKKSIIFIYIYTNKYSCLDRNRIDTLCASIHCSFFLSSLLAYFVVIPIKLFIENSVFYLYTYDYYLLFYSILLYPRLLFRHFAYASFHWMRC